MRTIVYPGQPRHEPLLTPPLCISLPARSPHHLFSPLASTLALLFSLPAPSRGSKQKKHAGVFCFIRLAPIRPSSRSYSRQAPILSTHRKSQSWFRHGDGATLEFHITCWLDCGHWTIPHGVSVVVSCYFFCLWENLAAIEGKGAGAHGT